MPTGLSDWCQSDPVGVLHDRRDIRSVSHKLGFRITMANESPVAGSGPVLPQPSASLSPSERARLTQCFQYGTQSATKNIDYAIEMFSACVVSDPANAIYLQHLLGALRVKHAGKKGGGLAALWAAGGRGGLRKLAAAGKWREAITQGIGIIKSNPADSGSFLVMAEVCGKLTFADAQRVYLKAALDADPSDFDVNRQCAAFLLRFGEYDQAIACWMRISKLKGKADEAQAEISRLQVDMTISRGEKMTGRKPVASAVAGQEAVGSPGGAPATSRRVALEQAIAQNPADIEAYLELADVLERDASVQEAEQVLTKALAASGNDLKVREHWEDRQLRWTRHRVHLAEKRLAEEDTPDNHSAVEKLRARQLAREIEIYSARSARYPENLIWKYELAQRLKAAGNHAEAIKSFQDVLVDVRRKGIVSLELGECFQKIRQYQLAMRNYQTAVETLTDQEQDLRKRALYRAGVLAAGLDDVDSARKYLSTLAELDFGYRDVAQRLDKLTPAKDNRAGS